MRVFLPLLFRKAKSNIDAKIKFEIAISLMLNILWFNGLWSQEDYEFVQ